MPAADPAGTAGRGRLARDTPASLEADPPVLLTTLRNQPEYPRVVAGLAWINTERTTLTLNPGRLEPSVSLPRGPMEVPQASRGRLLATFNSGFKLSDSKAASRSTATPMRRCATARARSSATPTGTSNVVDWHYGSTAPPSCPSRARTCR